MDVSLGESGGAVVRVFLGLPRQSDGGELMSSWAEWGMWDSQWCVGNGRLCFGSQRVGKGISNMLQAPTSSRSQGPRGIRLTGRKSVREKQRELHLPAAHQNQCCIFVIFGGGTVQYQSDATVDGIVFDPLLFIVVCTIQRYSLGKIAS